jgi:hypothetical protein
VDNGKATVIASAILGFCLLAHTGYTVLHNRSTAEANGQDQQRIAKAEKEVTTKAKSKGAWERATKDLDSELGSWINDPQRTEKGRYVILRWAWVKAYVNSDITWALFA